MRTNTLSRRPQTPTKLAPPEALEPRQLLAILPEAAADVCRDHAILEAQVQETVADILLREAPNLPRQPSRVHELLRDKTPEAFDQVLSGDCADLLTLTGRMASIASAITRTQAEIDDLNGQLATVTADRQGSATDLAHVQGILINEQHALSDLMATLTTLSDHIATLEHSAGDVSGAINGALSERTLRMNEIDASTTEQGTLRNELALLDRRISDLTTREPGDQKALSDAQVRESDTRNTLNAATTTLANAERVCVNAEQQQTTAQNTYNTAYGTWQQATTAQQAAYAQWRRKPTLRSYKTLQAANQNLTQALNAKNQAWNTLQGSIVLTQDACRRRDDAKAVRDAAQKNEDSAVTAVTAAEQTYNQTETGLGTARRQKQQDSDRIAVLDQTIAADQDRSATLETQIANDRQTLAQLSQQLQNATTEKQALESQIEALRTLIQSNQQEAARLRAEFALFDQEISDLTNRIQSGGQTLSQERVDLASAQIGTQTTTDHIEGLERFFRGVAEEIARQIRSEGALVDPSTDSNALLAEAERIAALALPGLPVAPAEGADVAAALATLIAGAVERADALEALAGQIAQAAVMSVENPAALDILAEKGTAVLAAIRETATSLKAAREQLTALSEPVSATASLQEMRVRADGRTMRGELPLTGGLSGSVGLILQQGSSAVPTVLRQTEWVEDRGAGTTLIEKMQGALTQEGTVRPGLAELLTRFGERLRLQEAISLLQSRAPLSPGEQQELSSLQEQNVANEGAIAQLSQAEESAHPGYPWLQFLFAYHAHFQEKIDVINDAPRALETLTPSFEVSVSTNDRNHLYFQTNSFPSGLSIRIGSVIVPVVQGTSHFPIPIDSLGAPNQTIGYQLQLISTSTGAVVATLGSVAIDYGQHRCYFSYQDPCFAGPRGSLPQLTWQSPVPFTDEENAKLQQLSNTVYNLEQAEIIPKATEAGMLREVHHVFHLSDLLPYGAIENGMVIALPGIGPVTIHRSKEASLTENGLRLHESNVELRFDTPITLEQLQVIQNTAIPSMQMNLLDRSGNSFLQTDQGATELTGDYTHVYGIFISYSYSTPSADYTLSEITYRVPELAAETKPPETIVEAAGGSALWIDLSPVKQGVTSVKLNLISDTPGGSVTDTALASARVTVTPFRGPLALTPIITDADGEVTISVPEGISAVSLQPTQPGTVIRIKNLNLEGMPLGEPVDTEPLSYRSNPLFARTMAPGEREWFEHGMNFHLHFGGIGGEPQKFTIASTLGSGGITDIVYSTGGYWHPRARMWIDEVIRSVPDEFLIRLDDRHVIVLPGAPQFLSAVTNGTLPSDMLNGEGDTTIENRQANNLLELLPPDGLTIQMLRLDSVVANGDIQEGFFHAPITAGVLDHPAPVSNTIDTTMRITNTGLSGGHIRAEVWVTSDLNPEPVRQKSFETDIGSGDILSLHYRATVPTYQNYGHVELWLILPDGRVMKEGGGTVQGARSMFEQHWNGDFVVNPQTGQREQNIRWSLRDLSPEEKRNLAHDWVVAERAVEQGTDSHALATLATRYGVDPSTLTPMTEADLVRPEMKRQILEIVLEQFSRDPLLANLARETIGGMLAQTDQHLRENSGKIIDAFGDVHTRMNPEVLARIHALADKAQKSALARGDQHTADRFANLLTAADGMLNNPTSPNASDWIATIERTTTDPSDYSIFYLLDDNALQPFSSAGHAATLVGSDSEGWYYYSFGYGKTGLYPQDNMNMSFFRTLAEAKSSPILNRYDRYLQWQLEDVKELRSATRKASSLIGTWYWIAGWNCDDAAVTIIRAAGVNIPDDWKPVNTFHDAQDSGNDNGSW